MTSGRIIKKRNGSFAAKFARPGPGHILQQFVNDVKAQFHGSNTQHVHVGTNW